MSDRLGSLALVLHSHMPYVEGYGTYPFGEEWLFDAVIRSYVPVTAVADRLTLTVTPVLADQLEADGVSERLLEFLRRFRIESCEADERRRDEPSPRPPAAPKPTAIARCSRASRRWTASCCGCSQNRQARGGSSCSPRRRPTRCSRW